MARKTTLDVGGMYIVKASLFCLHKNDMDIEEVVNLYTTSKPCKIQTNSIIMYIGSQKVDKYGTRYSLIMHGKELYYTYNPLKLEEILDLL